MRADFAPELICIADGGDLEITSVAEQDGDEITTGQLTCNNCGRHYNIRLGVPCVIEGANEEEEVARFGTQWTWFLEGKFDNPEEAQYGYDREAIVADFFDMTGLSKETLAGKRILDAGSGASKIAYFLTKSFPDIDFEIVSMEVSEATFVGAKRASEPRAPHVRADIFHPALRPESFDVVYSVGVLHHTADPRKAFEALVPLVKKGGAMATWVYSKRFNPLLGVTGWIWPLTRHLPNKAILAIAYVLAPFFWIMYRIAYVGKLLLGAKSQRWRSLVPLTMSGIRLRLFDFMQTYYRFRYWPEELVPWYEENGFDDVIVLRPGTNALRGIRK